MARYRRCIDGRYDQCSNLRIQKALDLLDHLYGIIVGFREPEFQSAVLRRQGQSAGDVLHELALIVLGKGEHGLKSRRDVAVWCSRIERWQHNRTRDPRWAIHRHRMAATYREQISDDERNRAEQSSRVLHRLCSGGGRERESAPAPDGARNNRLPRSWARLPA